MQPGRNTEFVEDLGRIFAGRTFPPGDRALLEEFVRGRDEAAFEALVDRHGPMVRGICRRILRDPGDADDAFQATFLVLFLKSRRIGDADRLAPWLFGVATRVAIKARARGARRRERLGSVQIDAVAPAPDHDLLDVMPLIDAEIARLPAKLRAAVVLCLVEGASLDEAARRLSCPVGTVKSRLARGREALRAQLRRQGVAPGVALAATDLIAPAPVSAALVRLTLATCLAPTIAPTLITLTQGVAPAMITKSTAIAALLVGGIVLAGGSLTTAWLKSAALAQQAAPANQAQARPQANPVRPSAGPATGEPRTPPAPVGPTKFVATITTTEPMADRLAAILAEFAAQQEVVRIAQEKATTEREQREIYTKLAPDDVIFSRRMVDLALTNPADPAARDALIWVINKPYRADHAAYGDEFARAGALLVRHHGDDPVAIEVGLRLTNLLSDRRDALVRGFYASAKSHEAQGIARLALAQYLEKKAEVAAIYRTHPKRGKRIFHVRGDDGKPTEVIGDEPDDDFADRVGLSLCDATATRAEAERLYHEVISDYGDIPFTNTKTRELAALLKEPEPKWNGKPLTADELHKLRASVEAKLTLGSVAEGHLDEMFNLIPGKPAPEIDGVDLNGKPLKLADYRGKVVVLAFWGSWCGPCMAAVPHERELAERLKDRPFAFLGVDCNEPQAAGLKAVQDHQIPWPNWHDGNGGTDGPIVARYHIRGYPSVFVIDAQGIIRYKQLSGSGLDKAVDDLLAELEAKPPAK